MKESPLDEISELSVEHEEQQHVANDKKIVLREISKLDISEISLDER